MFTRFKIEVKLKDESLKDKVIDLKDSAVEGITDFATSVYVGDYGESAANTVSFLGDIVEQCNLL